MAASTTTTDVFLSGKYKTVLIDTSSSGLANPPPKPLLIGSPAEVAGEFPVMVFLHGYLMETSFYSQLIQHVSSHGYIMVAPQVDSLSLSQIKGFNSVIVPLNIL